jgi:peptidoglycan/LPS O-acetylase OafA/YrhL
LGGGARQLEHWGRIHVLRCFSGACLHNYISISGRLLFLATLLAGALLNSSLWPFLDARFGDVPTDNFLYFWFPNQMSVFALGICLFFLLQRDNGRRSILLAFPNLIAALSMALVASTAFVAMPHWLDLRVPLPPIFILVSLAMMIFILALSRARPGFFLNAPVALMGCVSFSAYLLHFAVLTVIGGQPYFQNYLRSHWWGSLRSFWECHGAPIA